MDFKAKLALQIGMGGPGPPKKKSTRVVKTFGSAAGESSTDHPVTGNRNAAATAALMGGWGATQQNRSRGPESSTSVAPRLLVSAEARDRIRLGRESMSTRKRRPPTRSRVVRRPVGGGGATAAALTAGGGATAAAASVTSVAAASGAAAAGGGLCLLLRRRRHEAAIANRHEEGGEEEEEEENAATPTIKAEKEDAVHTETERFCNPRKHRKHRKHPKHTKLATLSNVSDPHRQENGSCAKRK